jgi:hypothetical protein
VTEPVLHYDESLGQNTRSGSWQHLAVGTYQVIQDEACERVGRRRNQAQKGTAP